MRFFIHLMTFLLSSLLSLSTVGLAILAGLYFIYFLIGKSKGYSTSSFIRTVRVIIIIALITTAFF